MTCQPTDYGPRVLRGRHLDQCVAPDCPGCEPCPDPHCGTCRKEHAEATCPTCLAMARTDLDAVVHLAGDLDQEATQGRAAHHTHDGLLGGDALVLLAPGHYTHGQYLDPEERADPRPPLAVLRYWARVWADLQDYDDTPSTLGDVASYLDGQLHHLAQELDLFPRLARDLHRTRVQLENVLHDGVRPDLSRVPCLACGTRLEKVWTSREKDDHWRCPRCGEVYDRGRYDRAQHDHLASSGADRYVPVMDAVTAVGRPEQTVRAWIRKGLVSTTRHPGSGRLLAWWPDVRSLHLNTQTRNRREVG